jgi:hypothetical protein
VRPPPCVVSRISCRVVRCVRCVRLTFSRFPLRRG